MVKGENGASITSLNHRGDYSQAERTEISGGSCLFLMLLLLFPFVSALGNYSTLFLQGAEFSSR